MYDNNDFDLEEVTLDDEESGEGDTPDYTKLVNDLFGTRPSLPEIPANVHEVHLDLDSGLLAISALNTFESDVILTNEAFWWPCGIRVRPDSGMYEFQAWNDYARVLLDRVVDHVKAKPMDPEPPELAVTGTYVVVALGRGTPEHVRVLGPFTSEVASRFRSAKFLESLAYVLAPTPTTGRVGVPRVLATLENVMPLTPGAIRTVAGAMTFRDFAGLIAVGEAVVEGLRDLPGTHLLGLERASTKLDLLRGRQQVASALVAATETTCGFSQRPLASDELYFVGVGVAGSAPLVLVGPLSRGQLPVVRKHLPTLCEFGGVAMFLIGVAEAADVLVSEDVGVVAPGVLLEVGKSAAEAMAKFSGTAFVLDHEGELVSTNGTDPALVDEFKASVIANGKKVIEELAAIAGDLAEVGITNPC